MASALGSALRSAFRVPPPGEPVAAWQISPAIDLAAYHFSWLWVLIPLLFAGPKHPDDYYLLFAIVLTVNILHRHFTMPYVYLDGDVFRRHATRFAVVPAVLFCGFVASPFLSAFRAPANYLGPIDAAAGAVGLALLAHIIAQDLKGFVFPRWLMATSVAPYAMALVFGFLGLFTTWHTGAVVAVVLIAVGASLALFLSAPREQRSVIPALLVATAAVATLLAATGAFAALGAWPQKPTKLRMFAALATLVAALWNFWHTPSQKFGMLRVYAAKQSEIPPEKRTPAWVDRWLIWGFMPLFFFTVGPSQREAIYKASKALRPFSMPVVDFVTALQPYLLPPTALFAIASVVLFFHWERKTSNLRAWPRVTMGIAMTLLHVAILVTPVKAYVAYGFSHGIEYMVFVWAYQRRRYAHPLVHRPLIQRLLTKPILAYGAYVVVVGGFFFYLNYSKKMGLPEMDVRPFDIKLSTWGFAWAVWHSMTHFYFDGFLWKMRLPTVRASI